jgi:hypothetical protein
MKPTMLVLALLAAVLGLTACAKYPVVLGTAAPAPSSAYPSAAPVPTR